MVDLQELIFYGFALGRCGGLERTECKQFLHWKGVVVLQKLIFNSFYIMRV